MISVRNFFVPKYKCKYTIYKYKYTICKYKYTIQAALNGENLRGVVALKGVVGRECNVFNFRQNAKCNVTFI